MRWEHLTHSTRSNLPVIVVALAIFLLMPMVAIALAAIAIVLILAARRHDQPIATEASDWGQRWYAWLVGAGVLALVGVGILLMDGDGDLSTVAWATWILSWVIAAALALVGVGLGAMRLRDNRRVDTR